jgi:hypothetical protein
VHEFKDTNVSNRFFDTSANPVASKIKVVSNANPSMVKTYQAVSLESNSAWTVQLFDSKGSISRNVSFSEREGAFYGEVEGISAYASYINDVNDSRYLPLGTYDSSDVVGGVSIVTLQNNIRGMHIPLNYTVFLLGDSSNSVTDGTIEALDSLTVTSVNRTTSEITLSGTISVASGVSQGDKLFIGQSGNGFTSDKIRDHYAVIDAQYTPPSSIVDEGIGGEELYAINAYFKNSPLNHAIG